MTLETWLAFVAASIILLIIPGPTILAVVSYSLTHGKRANVALVSAVALGDSTALAASLLGLGALLSTSAIWFTVVKVVGGVYLLYLGIKLLRSRASPLETKEPTHMESGWRLFLNTYLVTAFNPKGIVFFVAFLPQFIASEANPTSQLWILAVTFVALATVNACSYAIFASSARKLLASARAQQRFNLIGGLLLSAAGVWALFARRAG